jgi:hypothetical protein
MTALKTISVTMTGTARLDLVAPSALQPEINLVCLREIRNFVGVCGVYEHLVHVQYTLSSRKQFPQLRLLLGLPRLRSLTISELWELQPDFGLDMPSRCPLERLELVDCWNSSLAFLDLFPSLRTLKFRELNVRNGLLASTVPPLTRGRITMLVVSSLGAGMRDRRDLEGYDSLRSLTLEGRSQAYPLECLAAICSIRSLEYLSLEYLKHTNIGTHDHELASLPTLVSLDLTFLEFRGFEGQPTLQVLVLRAVPAGRPELSAACLAQIRSLPKLTRLTLSSAPGSLELPGLETCPCDELRLAGLRPAGKPRVSTLWIERVSFTLLSAELQHELKSIKNLYVVTKVEVP